MIREKKLLSSEGGEEVEEQIIDVSVSPHGNPNPSLFDNSSRRMVFGCHTGMSTLLSRLYLCLYQNEASYPRHQNLTLALISDTTSLPISELPPQMVERKASFTSPDFPQ
jgi:hypothetical protein